MDGWLVATGRLELVSGHRCPDSPDLWGTWHFHGIYRARAVAFPGSQIMLFLLTFDNERQSTQHSGPNSMCRVAVFAAHFGSVIRFRFLDVGRQ